jgi:hypothetical protein
LNRFNCDKLNFVTFVMKLGVECLEVMHAALSMMHCSSDCSLAILA